MLEEEEENGKPRDGVSLRKKNKSRRMRAPIEINKKLNNELVKPERLWL